MTISFVLSLLLAIVSGTTTFISADLAISSSHSPIDDTLVNENITYFRDNFGQLQQIDINQVNNDAVPFFSPEDDVIFELYTLTNPTEPQILSISNYSTILSSNFNWWKPTRIFIHGWNSRLHSEFTDAYLVKAKHNVNLIGVNWGKGSDTIFYNYARGRVNDVAERVALFVDFMCRKKLMKTKDLTIIGHSLGAHISGIAGKKIKMGTVNKIVGLDPALPLFKYDDVENRLAESDAKYVEVIHTCIGILGFKMPLGHASFYPNRGTQQPGCGRDIFGICAHGRSYEFYLESVITPQFFAFECDTLENVLSGKCNVVNQVVQMGGEPGISKSKGLFYLETNEKPLYARGLELILKKKIFIKT